MKTRLAMLTVLLTFIWISCLQACLSKGQLPPSETDGR